MAEIPVQPKSGARPWGWIIALIILAVILWIIFGHRTHAPATTTTGSATPAHIAPALASSGSATWFLG